MDAKSLIILICFCVLILCFNPLVEGDIRFGMCADPKCSVPIGRGITTIRYSSPDDQKISVNANEEVLIYVKDYGPKKDLLGIIVRGNKGYISRQFVREIATFHKSLVPSVLEFKTSHLVTTTSHLHTSPQYHASSQFQVNSPESFIHPQPSNILPPDFRSESIIHDSFSSQLHSSGQVHPSVRSQPSINPVDKIPHHSSVYDLNYGDLSSNYPQPRQPDGYFASNTPNKKSSLDDDTASLHGSLNSISNTQGSVSQQYHTSSNVIRPRQTISPSDSNMQHLHPSQSTQQHFQSSHNLHHQNLHPSQRIQNEVLSSTQIFNQHPTHNIPEQPFATQDRHQQNLNPSGYHHSSPTLSGQPVQPSPSNHHHPSLNKHPVSDKHRNIPTANPQQQQPGMQNHIHHEKTLPINVQHSSVHAQTVQESPSKMPQNLNDMIDDDYSSNDEWSITLSLLEQYEKNSIKSDLNSESTHFQSSQNVKLDSSQSQQVSSQKSDHSTHSSSSLKSNALQDDNVLSSRIVSKEDINYVDASNEDLLNNKDLSIDSESDETEYDYDSLFDDEGKNLSSKENLNDSNVVLDNSISESSKIESTEVVSNSQSAAPESSTGLPLKKYIESESQQDISKPEKDEDSESNYHSPDEISKNITENLDEILKIDTTLTNEHFKTISDHSLSEENKLHGSEKFGVVPGRNNNAEQPEIESLTHDSLSQISEILTDGDEKSQMSNIQSTPKTDPLEDLNTYQGRNLKGESTTAEESHSDSDVIRDENVTQSEDDIFTSFENWLAALKSTLDSFISWIPEPLYTAIMDLQNKGISPRVPVFTAICGFVIIMLIVPLYFIKEFSKEAKLSTQLAHVEKDAYTLSATNAVLEEKLQSVQCLLKTYEKTVVEEKQSAEKIKMEFEELTDDLENTKAELESCLEEIESLKRKEKDYLSLLSDNAKEKKELNEQKSCLEKLVKENEDTISSLTDQLRESETNLEQLENERTQYMQLKEDYEEKLSQFERNCSQLLQEAEVWNLRVNELTVKVNEERALKEETEGTLKERDEEIESLKQLVETFRSFEEIEDPEEKEKTKEEKLQILLKSSMILNQLEKQVQETKLLSEQLEKEKNKILDMEVELLEARSEIDKLKMSYNQALQDKAEAQTKLDVLTNYFKDKEIQLQRQLGAQEAVRQKKEEDASSAERRIILIEQENASYKYQVASMKQEMEETERNLKSQIATQEKKAHENWIAARAAERKLEETKQEITQLHQRLTLLERERQNFEREEIIRPVPKRANDEVGNQDMNISDRSMFQAQHERPPPPPHMLLPLDRPLPPPFPPHPPPPMFMPPMDRHFRLPPPWHLHPDPGSDFRSTPPEFMPGRESTPPRRPFPLNDGDGGPHASSSPLTTDARDSRNSTPPHLLPDFHDIPPQPGRPPFYPPPHPHQRLPMHPPFRRDMGPGHKKLENPNELNPRNNQQQPPPQEQWQHSRV